MVNIDSSTFVGGGNPTALAICDETYSNAGVNIGFSITSNANQSLVVVDGIGINQTFSYDGANWVTQSSTSFDHVISMVWSANRLRITHDSLNSWRAALVSPSNVCPYQLRVNSFQGITDVYFYDNANPPVAVTVEDTSMSFSLFRPGTVRFTQTSWDSFTGHSSANFWLSTAWTNTA